MLQDKIHLNIVQNKTKVQEWFKSKSEGLCFPVYSSFDIRDSGYKVAPVDANIFPAGFNNICQTDKDSAVEIMHDYLDYKYSSAKNIILVAEEHTKNPYYWENVKTLFTLVSESGRNVVVAWPKEGFEKFNAQTTSGEELEVYPMLREGDDFYANGVKADLVISNNDFSVQYEIFTKEANVPMNPSYKLGWHSRRKNQFFIHYNELAREFCEIIDIDPWFLQVETIRFQGFDIRSDGSREKLAQQVEIFLNKEKEKYEQYKIASEPFVFVKNNSGTYGLGVTQAQSADEVRSWNNKARKKMKAVKGGGEISEVIIQEGIPTYLKEGEEIAEPAIYMIGQELAGGFLRAHKSKGPKESLNSPGAVYKRLCVSDLNINIEGYPLENVYGWVAKLGVLAVAREFRDS